MRGHHVTFPSRRGGFRRVRRRRVECGAKSNCPAGLFTRVSDPDCNEYRLDGSEPGFRVELIADCSSGVGSTDGPVIGVGSEPFDGVGSGDGRSDTTGAI
jgi:hypothetical protein